MQIEISFVNFFELVFEILQPTIDSLRLVVAEKKQLTV